MSEGRNTNIATKLFLIGIFSILGVFSFPDPSSAATGIHSRINFQGKVVNDDGTNVTDGNYDFVFRIYTASTGGSAIWTETWNSGTAQIPVDDGIFQTELGTHVSLPGSIDFNTDNIYLSVEFAADGEMSPRIRFTAVPYAFNAEKVSGLTVTDTTGTLTVANGKTVSFADAFTTSGAFPLTFTATASTSVTLPTTGTLATLAGTEEFTNKTIGSTGLTFSGAATDIAAASGEGLTILGNAASSFTTTTGTLTLAAAGSGTVGTVQIGAGGAGSATPDFFGLDVKSTTGDPSGGFEGAMYYNAYDDRFRCYQGSGWTDCIGSGSGGMSIGGTITSATQGSILFAGSAGILAQDNANFFWDDSTNRLGLGTATPAAMLSLFGTSNAIRLSYDASHYTTLSANGSGDLAITGSSVTDSSVTLGNDSANDAAVLFDNLSQDYYIGVDDTDSAFKIGLGQTMGATPALVIDDAGNVGLVASSYLNWGSALGSSGYGIRDNAGTMEYRNSGGSWTGIGSGGGGMSIGGSITSATEGSILFAGATGILAQDNANFFWDDTNDFLGIGTATPATPLDVIGGARFGDGTNYAGVDADGDLSFTGTADYLVGADDYAFRYSGDEDFGMFFNGTSGAVDILGDGQALAHRFSVVGSTSYIGTVLGIGTTGPDHMLDVLDATNPQLRLTQTDGTVFTDFQTTASGDLYIDPSGNDVGIGDVSPDHTLDVAGNIGLDASSYINFGDTDGVTGYGIRDNAGAIEYRNSSGSWTGFSSSGSALTVRESDATPSVSTVSTIEFGSASTSSDEFIVTDQTGGVSRIRIGNQVGLLNEAETASGAWTFSNGLSIGSAQAYTGAGAVTLSSAAASGLTIESGTTGTIVIGADASAETITIGTGAAAKTITIGSTDTTSTTTIQSGTGGITLEAAGTATTDTVQIGAGGAGSATPDLLVLDVKSTAGDPAATKGAIYYNDNSGKFRCSENGTTFVDCIGSGGSPGGSTTKVQYNNAGAFGGATNVEIENDYLRLPVTSVPSSVAANGLNVYARSQGGRIMPAFVGPSGLDYVAQPSLGRNKVAWWNPAGNSTTITAIGAAALTATGTATTATTATTNRYTQMKKIEYLVTTASTTAVAGFRNGAAHYHRGANANDGGFHMMTTWGPATGVATATNRAFVGMRGSTAAPTDVDPSTLANILGFGWDDDDTNIQFMHNDGSGTATKVDLGSSFPVPTTDRSQMYETIIFAAPNGSTIGYKITDLVTGAIAEGEVSTDLPAATQLLAPRGHMSAGGTSSVIGIALSNMYIETDF